MSSAARSLLIFSIYMFALGATLVVVPNVFLSIFGIPETHEVWLRIVGMLVLILGFYDFLAARHEMKIFFKWSVWARLPVVVFFAAFVALGLAPPILILFGAIDAAAAVWTFAALRKDRIGGYQAAQTSRAG